MKYRRFYSIIGRMPGVTDETKGDLVSRFTSGRTTSLKEMEQQEYDTMCDVLEHECSRTLRKRRSVVLTQIQKLGVDTSDWSRINAFCLDKRIAGKPFAKLTSYELEALAVRLRAIIGKGGLKVKEHERQPQVEVCFVVTGKIRAEA